MCADLWRNFFANLQGIWIYGWNKYCRARVHEKVLYWPNWICIFENESLNVMNGRVQALWATLTSVRCSAWTHRWPPPPIHRFDSLSPWNGNTTGSRVTHVAPSCNGLSHGDPACRCRRPDGIFFPPSLLRYTAPLHWPNSSWPPSLYPITHALSSFMTLSSLLNGWSSKPSPF